MKKNGIQQFYQLKNLRSLSSSTYQKFIGTQSQFKMARVLPTKSLRMLLIGAPGSGKGTQSIRINTDFGLESISSGDVLRRHIREGTPAGKAAKEVISTGALLSDDIMLSVLQSELSQLDKKNWLLDGFPRNVTQAKALDEKLSDKGDDINLVIHLDVPEEVILSRIIDRWVHVPSGRVYNLSYNPPKVFGIDDVTGEKLTKREDDNPDVFKKRLEQFRNLTTPLLDFYDKKNVLVKISGPTSDVIYPQIKEEISKRLTY